MRKDHRSAVRSMELIEATDDNLDSNFQYHALHIQEAELVVQIKELETEKDALTKRIAELSKQKTIKAKKLTDFARARKSQEDSVYSGIDRILQDYNIQRARYHGGDLTGGHIKVLMENAHQIMERMEQYLWESRSAQFTGTRDEVKHECDSVCTLLICWDGALSVMHREDPTENDYSEVQLYIDHATKIARRLGMSKMVKGHGGEVHIVKQMRMLEGGLVDFDESWGEQYHQFGHNFDMKYRSMGSEIAKAKVRAAADRRNSRPETMAALKKTMMKHARGKRKSTVANVESTQNIKKERRERVLRDL